MYNNFIVWHFVQFVSDPDVVMEVLRRAEEEAKIKLQLEGLHDYWSKKQLQIDLVRELILFIHQLTGPEPKHADSGRSHRTGCSA